MLPTDNIGYLLQHLSFVLARQSDQALQEQLGIGFSQFKILMVLHWKPNVQQRLIADKLGQTEASISRQIRLMADDDLLRSTRSPQNKREHITQLTSKGLKITEEAMRILNEYHAPVFEQLSSRQQQQLLEILKLMHERACQRYKPGLFHPTDI